MKLLPAMRKRYEPAAGRKPVDMAVVCTISGCGRRVHHFGAAMCGKHAMRASTNGHPTALAVKHKELWSFAGYINAGLLRFDTTVAYHEALRRAGELLRFEATTSEPWQRYLQMMMGGLRHKAGRYDVTPRDVVVAVLCLFAFEQAHPDRLPNEQSHLIALCRAVVKLGRHAAHKQPGKSELVGTGQHVAGRLGAFAVTFLSKWRELHRREAIKEAASAKRITDFDSLNESSGARNASPTDLPKDIT